MSSSKPCGGGDMWRRVEGCVDIESAARQPQGDLPCDRAAGVSVAGFCDCTTGAIANQLPRHLGCGVTKRPCREVCAAPVPKSTLPAAFGEAVSEPAGKKDGGDDEAEQKEPWWKAHVPTLVVSGAVLFLLVVHHFTNPAHDERKKFERLLRAQRRQVAFERSFER